MKRTHVREYYRKKHGTADFGGEVSEHNRGYEAGSGIKTASVAASSYESKAVDWARRMNDLADELDEAASEIAGFAGDEDMPRDEQVSEGNITLDALDFIEVDNLASEMDEWNTGHDNKTVNEVVNILDSMDTSPVVSNVDDLIYQTTELEARSKELRATAEMLSPKKLEVKKPMTAKIMDQYIKDYEMGNLKVSPGGNFQDFLNRLITHYEKTKGEQK